MLNEYDMVIENIKKIIKDKGMKQCVVAERAGFSRSELSNILNRRKMLRIEHINLIAQALNVEVNTLFKRKGGEESGK